MDDKVSMRPIKRIPLTDQNGNGSQNQLDTLRIEHFS